MSEPTSDEAVAVREVLDKVLGPLPIYATRIGYRAESTDEERRLGDFLFSLARQWEEFKENTTTADVTLTLTRAELVALGADLQADTRAKIGPRLSAAQKVVAAAVALVEQVKK